MKLLKRLLLVFGFFPVIITSCVIWLFIGKDPFERTDSFVDFCINNNK